MTVNLTAYVEADCAEQGYELGGWWAGWITERVYVIPINDSGIHVSPGCGCKPHAEIIQGTAMLVHDAFDGRQFTETALDVGPADEYRGQ